MFSEGALLKLRYGLEVVGTASAEAGAACAADVAFGAHTGGWQSVLDYVEKERSLTCIQSGEIKGLIQVKHTLD
jgi:hypothetical protein